MIALVVFALVGAAAAQFSQFAPAQQFAPSSFPSSFAGSDAQLLPPVFPVSQTRVAPLRPIAPLAPLPAQRSFASPLASSVPLATPVSRPIQFDSNVFVDSGVPAGFHGQRNQPAITIVERKEIIDPAGQYSTSWRDSAGSSASEQGHLKPTNDHLDNVVAKEGQYSWVDPEGKTHAVTYTADEYGFHPSSDDIPRPVAPITPVF